MADKLTLEKVDIKGKRVLLRVDWNVPLGEDGTIGSDARIQATLPTLRAILDGGAAVIAMSHLGRPEGERVPSMSLAPVAKHLGTLLEGVPVAFCEACRGEAARAAAERLQPGEVLVLENLRFEPGETANDPDLAKDLAALGDVYVNDAFGTCHRAHASVVGVAEHLQAAAGLLLAREIEVLTPLLEIDRQSPSPPRPFVALLGGAKVKDKVGVLDALIPKLDGVLIGGAMAYTFMKAKGQPIGRSRFEEEKIEDAKRFIALAGEHGTDLHLPGDHVCASGLDGPEDGPAQVESEIPDGLMGLDIGPETATRFREVLQRAGTVVWNGPMGVFEQKRFAGGTRMLAQSLGTFAKGGKCVVAGGGETVQAAQRFGVYGMLTHVSTGGGAFLELLEGRGLPGIEALSEA